MMCGGHSQPNEMTDEVREMVNSLKPKIEGQMNSQFSDFEAINYTTQVVAGTNFVVKIRVGADKHISVTIFRPLPCNGTECEVTNAVSL